VTRCLNIANSHALLSSHRNALALLLRASSLSGTAVSSLSSQKSTSTVPDGPPRLDITNPSLKSLHTHLTQKTLQTRALVELHKHNENSALAAKKGMTSSAPVVESLDIYPTSGTVDLGNLVQWPPKLRPIPVKPLFLDLAWNYIEYPGKNREAASNAADGEEKSGEKATAAKKGWFGFGR
jgi:signal recognition particle subunit SRP68